MARPAKITVEHQGQQLSLAQLSRVTGISFQTLHKRYLRGWRGAELVAPCAGTPTFANRYRGLL